ncbi:hypothetical protein [Burkholderia stagnalis]|uniref:hypothetical protein n=1 Tax=Burkholderia stagnalis TaxID=1503054 RepID=UPI000F56ADC9|nr:hypothetical protein [Burkholderia stagnalis]RQR11344.1 hypothetical protein DF025_17430 [Burkholderia stagnalis]RQR20374.1 hypothetical protein DF026_17240 [Burkholderia stagnalis]
MNTLFVISLVANALLGLALVAVVRTWRSERRFASAQLLKERDDAKRTGEALEHLRAEYGALAVAVATSLESIREDINRNYHHTHDGHVLDTIAYRLRREVTDRRGAYEIQLYDYEIRDVKALGGETSSRGTMTLGQMLAFGWQLHSRSRERAAQLIEVVSQPCGNREHANWLGKVLAIYELMCDRNKDLAIQRLSAVIQAWRYEPAQFAPRYVEDVRS